MTRAHIPVLAGELIDLLDPQPGEVELVTQAQRRLVTGGIEPFELHVIS